jgi:hypothetical protein
MSDLVALARRFVSLSDELESVRGEIKHAVLNGGGDAAPPPRPTPARSKPGRSKSSPPAHIAAAAKAEREIVDLLKASPGLKAAQMPR